MDPRYQRNREPARPSTAQGQASSASQHVSTRVDGPSGGERGLSKKWLASLIILALLLVGGAVAWSYLDTKGVDKSKYQAVFLVNDQVYFGKISKISDDVLVINDIYYLQQTKKDGADQNQNAASAQQANTSLAKLGNEVHGPQDEMRINMDQVLFWENLKDDGQVSKAIKEYKK